MKRQDRLTVSMTIPWSGPNNRKYFLKHLIDTNSFVTMAEIGVRDGRTTFFLLDHCPTLTIYAVDRSITGFYNSTVAQQYGSRLVPLEGDSSTMADTFADESLDLIFIDADHSYHGVSKDIIRYRSKIQPHGMLTGHDIDYPGVNKAVHELIKNFDVGPNFVWIAKK